MGPRGLHGRLRLEVCIFTREIMGPELLSQGRDGDLLEGGNEGAKLVFLVRLRVPFPNLPPNLPPYVHCCEILVNRIHACLTTEQGFYYESGKGLLNFRKRRFPLYNSWYFCCLSSPLLYA